MSDVILPSDDQPAVDAPQPEAAPPTAAAKRGDVFVISRVMLNYAVIAVTFLIVGLVLGGLSFGGGAGVDEDGVERVVRSLLEDASILRPIQDMDRLVDDDPSIGPDDAPVVMVEFSAYACPYCGRFHNETLPPLLENYGEYIRYVYRDFPSVNPEVSYAAALAANCALEQERFWDYQTILYENQELLGSTYFLEVAEELDLDMDAFQQCFQSQQYLSEVENDLSAGLAVGISGTPSFYINGKFYSGARPYAFFENVILSELEEAGIQPES